ncbi:MAG: hypothetical protein RL518_2612 [Pseudomonadota bacterium]
MVRKRSRIRVPSWAPFSQNVHYTPYGEVPEWLKGADCKSAGYGLRGFESLSHQFLPLNAVSPAQRGFSRSTLWSRGWRPSRRLSRLHPRFADRCVFFRWTGFFPLNALVLPLNALVQGLAPLSPLIAATPSGCRLMFGGGGCCSRRDLFQSPTIVLEFLPIYGLSSIGRAADSKSAGWGFDSLRPCTVSPIRQYFPFGIRAQDPPFGSISHSAFEPRIPHSAFGPRRALFRSIRGGHRRTK